MNQIIATVKDGKVEYDKGLMQTILMPLEGRRVCITFEKFSGKKSRAQLGFIFAGIVGRAAKEYGCDQDAMYSLLMDECNKRPVVNKRTGEQKFVSFGLSKIDKYETCEVIDRCIRYLAENGISVETPDEYFERLKLTDRIARDKE